MRKELISAIAILMFASVLLPTVSASVSRDSYPRLEEAIGIVSYPEATAMGKARAGEIDVLGGMISPDNVEELQGLGWNISAAPGFHMCKIHMNCRDVAPDTAGQPSSGGATAPYGTRMPGFPLYPMNLSQFRYALHLLAGSQKTDWIASLYRFINVRLDQPMPASFVFWVNPDLPPVPFDAVQAYNILTGIGFSNSTGKWLMPNGQELRKISVMAPVESPQSVTMMGYFVTAWNNFFGTGSDGKPYFEVTALIFNDELDFMYINRDFDMGWGCMSFGSNHPDWLYDVYSSEVDIADGSNTAGVVNPQLDELLHAIKYWRFTNGTQVTDINVMQKLVWQANAILYVLNPGIPVYSRKYHNAYKPGLQDWVESFGYGSFGSQLAGFGATYNWINWKGTATGVPDPTKTSWRFHIGGALGKLNPITSTTAYDWQVMNRLFDSMLDINPYTQADILAAASEWTPKGSYTPYTNATEGVTDGMKVTFKLRSGIKWQDGEPVDANTVKWNFDFIASIKPGRYYDIYANYIKSTVAPDNKTIDIYINSTGVWLVYSFSGGLLLPPKIYGPNGPADADKNGNVTLAEVTAFKPYETPHPTVSGLTCLIGTSTWIFKEWNKLTNTVLLVKNADSWLKDFLREDLNFDGVINIQDISLSALAFGADKNHPRWRYGEADVTGDGKVNIQDITKLALKWQKVTLPKS